MESLSIHGQQLLLLMLMARLQRKAIVTAKERLKRILSQDHRLPMMLKIQAE